jgi:hypothetical protein
MFITVVLLPFVAYLLTFLRTYVQSLRRVALDLGHLKICDLYRTPKVILIYQWTHTEYILLKYQTFYHLLKEVLNYKTGTIYSVLYFKHIYIYIYIYIHISYAEIYLYIYLSITDIRAEI